MSLRQAVLGLLQPAGIGGPLRLEARLLGGQNGVLRQQGVQLGHSGIHLNAAGGQLGNRALLAGLQLLPALVQLGLGVVQLLLDVYKRQIQDARWKSNEPRRG